jgi:hypothetical protein
LRNSRRRLDSRPTATNNLAHERLNLPISQLTFSPMLVFPINEKALCCVLSEGKRGCFTSKTNCTKPLSLKYKKMKSYQPQPFGEAIALSYAQHLLR